MTRVLVIGGGLGGLCLAQGLRRAGVSCAVYERDHKLDARLQGYRINIEATGSAALQSCLPPALWRIVVATAGDPGPGLGVFDHRLRRLAHIGSHDRTPDGEHAVSRLTLRRLLLAGLDDLVHLGKEFTHYEQHDDGTVTAHFADGSSATGDLLIGADGARSRVRRQLLPTARTVDPLAVGVGGKVPLTAQASAWLPPTLLAGKNMVLPDQGFLFTAVFRRRQTVSEAVEQVADELRALGVAPEVLLAEAADYDYLMWAYVAHRDSCPADVTTLSGATLRDVVADRARTWHPDLHRLVGAAAPNSVSAFTFSAAAPLQPWPAGSVTLLGDAAHHMPPVGGLGGNAALHDAALLCQVLSGGLPSESALAEYQRQMLRHGFAAVSESMRNVRVAVQGRPARSAVRAFFRTCGVLPPLQRAVLGS
ncbi:FAD-dependent oxidoreductase [Plantactinospora solaniradicis]|uniref:FAD-dependent oxidoreductase n=1 Tax=Plantactinospora solaniradicis TaxID=1723736 RepID=A0ABW1K657_9ACTN